MFEYITGLIGPKTLDGILSGFTKAQSELVEHIAQQSFQQASNTDLITTLHAANEDITQDKERAHNALSKINEIVGIAA